MKGALKYNHQKFSQLNVELETGQNLTLEIQTKSDASFYAFRIVVLLAIGRGHMLPVVQLGNLCTDLCSDLFVMNIYIFQHPDNREK